MIQLGLIVEMCWLNILSSTLHFTDFLFSFCLRVNTNVMMVICLLFQKPHILRQLGRLDKTTTAVINNVRHDNVEFDNITFLTHVTDIL